MLIIADENMPFVREWFAPFGTVRTLPGRALTADQVRDADALLVRSVTRVNRELLQGSRVRFVGSATSGIEHVDADYLRAQGIGCASAPGCNATAVVEYVLSCLCALDGVLEKLLAGGVVGIIGLGNVGARLTQRLQALGIHCVGYDPFLTPQSGLPLCDLDTVLNADVVCCHTPLTATGAYPTRHLLDIERLRRLRKDAVLINAGRGAVVDNAALLDLLRERDDVRAVLDVWESEPAIELALLDAVTLATPHIAGYSWDGKVAGTRAVLDSFCGFFHLPLASECDRRQSDRACAWRRKQIPRIYCERRCKRFTMCAAMIERCARRYWRARAIRLRRFLIACEKIIRNAEKSLRASSKTGRNLMRQSRRCCCAWGFRFRSAFRRARAPRSANIARIGRSESTIDFRVRAAIARYWFARRPLPTAVIDR